MNGRKFIGASVLTIALMLGAAGTANATEVQDCVDLITAIQDDLNNGGQCDGVVLVAGRGRSSTGKTCESLNSKLETAVEKLESTKGPKEEDAIKALQNFIDSLNTKAAQGKILDGSASVVDLAADAQNAQVCIVNLPD